MDRDLKAELTGLALGLSGLLLFAAIVDEVERFEEQEELTTFDRNTASWVAEHVPGPVVAAGLLLAEAGSLVVVAPLVLAASAVSWWQGRPREAVAIFVGALVLQLTVSLLKWFFARPRPEVGLVVAPHPSFPSGHAAFGAYLAVVLIWFAIRDVSAREWSVPLVALAGTWAFLQAAGRVLISVHFVSDVLAGLGLGFAVGGFGLAAVPLGERVSHVVQAVRGAGP